MKVIGRRNFTIQIVEVIDLGNLTMEIFETIGLGRLTRQREVEIILMEEKTLEWRLGVAANKTKVETIERWNYRSYQVEI